MGTGWRRSRGRTGCGRLNTGVSTLGQADWGALNAGRAVKGLEMESGWRWDRRVRPSPESGRTLGIVTPHALACCDCSNTSPQLNGQSNAAL